MARKAVRSSTKADQSPSRPSVEPQNGPPPPFELPAANFAAQFLTDLPQNHVYIVHVDKTSRELKRQVFFVPVCINLVLPAALIWRLYYAVPTYINLVQGSLGYSTPSAVDINASTRGELLWLTISRALLLLVDYLLFTLLGPWPFRFVFGVTSTRYSSPLKWRRAIGFKDEEVVVRKSRDWDRSLAPDWTIDDELTLKHKIMPAVIPQCLDKTGYLLEDKNWSLDFRAMIDAHASCGTSSSFTSSTSKSPAPLQLADFEKAVLVHYPPSGGPQGGWMIWRVSREDQTQTAAQRDALLRFKEKLTAMGYEDLFYRWVELVQYESSFPGGFTEGRQAVAMREAKRMFEEKGVDFAKFWHEVGGAEGMPGLAGR